MSSVQVAQKLHDYMDFRAAQEGLRHTLTVDFYRDAIEKGVDTFFGVVVDENGLLIDTQQLAMFLAWKEAASA